ncbi:YdgH/BhsA/McbA-like domain containing protein [Pantoea sp. Cy-640]|uniref:YdgH/BhsA/McbA-like domain containing protein n=1 Tax=Pantoea sp. Cy-640 TaxID=2608353 RepID=UPI0014198291|nr:YdgH/BhsA/McbA-like domain containing protein [Pantoea sp. Cy-640]NIG16172.1 DUF1471 domain-containing protein [Pantoea sp. Cy-640]
MKKLKNLFVTLPALAFVTGTYAAEVTQDSSGSKIGTVSASGAYSLDDLTQKLSDKAESEGAKSFKIISAGGENKMFGVAEIYK